MIQAQSLYEDRDWDIQNNLMKEFHVTDPSEMDRSYTHIAPTSRGHHWYSWHPCGLPLLIAPLWGCGMIFQQLFLGMILALGCVGM
jgi:hypothetical protein